MRAGVVDELLLPAPTERRRGAVGGPRAARRGPGGRPRWEVVLGLALAIVLGAALAVAMHLSRPLRTRAAPAGRSARRRCRSPVIAPLFILVLGFGLAPKVLMVALVCFFPVTINLYDGLRDVDPDARKLLRSLDATRWQRLRLLEAPAALPATFTGVKIAAAVAVIGAVFAEWAGSDRGLGHTLLIANGQLETARAFAATVLLFALAIALYGSFALLERRVVDWTPRTAPLEDHETPLALAALLIACSLAARRLRREGRARRRRRRRAPSRCGSCSTTSPTPTTPASTPRRPPGEFDRAGLDVEIKAPPDPSAPLKLLRAGARRPRRSPTSPSCCWRATRAPTTSSRSARSCRSR